MKRLCIAFTLLMIANHAHAVAIHASADPVKDEPKITEKDREHWAFKPLANVEFGARNADWQKVSAELDALAKTESKPADTATLIRRLTFDLTGLPPTLEELEKFVPALSVSPHLRVSASSSPEMQRNIGPVSLI